jgi:hypothetical protein
MKHVMLYGSETEPLDSLALHFHDPELRCVPGAFGKTYTDGFVVLQQRPSKCYTSEELSTDATPPDYVSNYRKCVAIAQDKSK